MVMVICLSIVIDDLVTWNTWYAISYVFGITLFFLFFLVTSSDCEESNVYHLKKYPFHPGVVHRSCGSCFSYVFMYMFCKINDESS